MLKRGRQNGFKNRRTVTFVGVRFPLAALISDNVVLFTLLIFIYVIAYFFYTGQIPNYSNNLYIIYGFAAVLLYLALFTKPFRFKRIKNQFDKNKNKHYNKRHKKKRARSPIHLLKVRKSV